MGIKGLYSFISQKFRHWEPVDYNCKVIIDGNNICYSLYKKFPWALGGEYDKFASEIEKFFDTFNFDSPIVVFDGARWDDSKAETRRERRRANMIKMSKVQRSDDDIDTSSPDNFPPTLALYTFIATLKQLKIQCQVSDGESDNDIAALADKHDCPVLSADSDFFLFNLKQRLVIIVFFVLATS